MVLAELLQRTIAKIGDEKLLTFLSVDDQGTYREERRSCQQLLDTGAALARTLESFGLRRCAHFAVMMANHPEFVEALVAASIIGAVVVPIDPRAKGELLAYMLDFAECEGVICSHACLPAIAATLSQCPKLRWAIAVDDEHPFAELAPMAVTTPYKDAIAIPASDASIAPSPDSWPMLIVFTSGTTGTPKGVVISHADMLGGAQPASNVHYLPDDKLYTGLSLAHIHGLVMLRDSLALGLSAVISRRFTKSRLWDICRRYRCTVFNLLGGMFIEIWSEPTRPDDADNPVRVINSSGMPVSLWKRFCQRFGVMLMEGYGSTEGGMLQNLPGQGPIGSIGKPPAQLDAAILDEGGRTLNAGEEGEICFRRKDGAPIEVKYLKDAQASAEKTRGGWLHTGDLGHRDDDGWFYFHYRAGGAIRKNGDFIDPSIVELGLAKYPLVSDVFVYGVQTSADAAGEKTLVSAIVPNDPERFSVDDFLTFCHGTLERRHVPEIIQILDEIPKTISRKPIERACIELLLKERDHTPHRSRPDPTGDRAYRQDPSLERVVDTNKCH